MATIDVKLSADVVVKAYGPGGESGRDIGNMVAAFGAGAVAASQAAATGASWSLAGSTLRVDFGNGASLQYTGVSITDPNAQRGTAQATGMAFYQDGVLSMSQTGHYDVGYTLVNNSLSLTSVAGTTTGGQFATLVPAGAAAYSPTLGNIHIGFDGRLVTDASGVASGEITHIAASADRLVASTTIDGAFQFSGSLQRIGSDLEEPVVKGVLTGFRTDYQDGSHEYVAGAIRIEAGESIDDAILNPARLSGDDVIRFELPASLPSVLTIAAGAGNDQITVGGGGALLDVQAGSGNDVITVLSDSHFIDGGEGVDTLKLGLARGQYKVVNGAQGTDVVTATGTDHQTLHGVERIVFADAALALDVEGNAGQAYRLYRAAFDREPDQGGLSFWIKSLDVGVSLNQAASNFIKSDEFAQLYGSAPTEKAFLTSLYQNVLHRAPDDGGYAFWLDGMAHGVTRATVLQQFSESPENQAQVNEVFVTGVKYDPNPF